MEHLLMRRQLLLAAGLCGWSPRLLAHHGWSSFDESRPLYVAGVVRGVKWQNPHGELQIETPEKIALPADLASRVVPKQSYPVDGAAVLGKARAPSYSARSWTLELAPVSRLDAWSLRAPAAGTQVAAVGYAHPTRQDAMMRVEYLFVGQNIYGLRSLPAPA